MSTRRYEERAARNDGSRNRAEHYREPWTNDEDAFLREEWDGTEETLETIAELLGRTIEACRQRYYCPRGWARMRIYVEQTVTSTYEVCPDCFQVITPSGECGC
jgi:hypothetical protein